MSRRIYVAGGSDERDECAADILILEASGWEITFNWTLPENYQHPDRALKIRRDLQGVIEAPYLWLRVPVAKTEGGHVELGTAIVLRDMLSFPALGMPHPRCIVVSGPWDSGHRLFTHAADLKFPEHAKALQWLLEYAP